jgi:hypothetical protein
MPLISAVIARESGRSSIRKILCDYLDAPPPRGMTLNETIQAEIITSRADRQSGRLSCFFCGISMVLVRSIESARAIRWRVVCGMITSSI